MNKIYSLILLILISSCGNQAELQDQINQLQAQNDSLTLELKKYESKYVFDKVFVKHYPIKNSRVKKGEKYYGEFVFVPDVKKDLVQFRTEPDNSKRGYEIKNPIMLKTKTGGFGAYEFEIDIKNEISLKHQNASYNGMTITDILIAE